MDTYTCACGALLSPKSKTDVTRHEATAKHQTGVQNASEERAFAEADRDARDEDGWDLDVEEPEPEPEPTPEPDVEDPFAALDATDAAKAFTPMERTSIINSIAATKAALDLSLRPKEVAEAYVAAVIDGTPNINEDVLPDLQVYAKGVVEVLRADAKGATPAASRPKEAKAPKAEKVKTPKVVNVGDHKVCRVCSIDKPLTEYRVKASRPDGRDTICGACAKAYDQARAAERKASK